MKAFMTCEVGEGGFMINFVPAEVFFTVQAGIIATILIVVGVLAFFREGDD